MRFLLKVGLALLILGGLGAAGYFGATKFLMRSGKVNFRTAEVDKGDITHARDVNGTVQPILRVQVGTFVSGPIKELSPEADFNKKVKKDQILARIDPRIYEAAVARDKANLAAAEADVTRVSALLQQAKNDELRAEKLRAVNEDYLADTVMDKYKFNRMSLEAQLEVAKASIQQALAALSNSEANLDYTKICAPRDGIIIDRKIDEGQTLAAQFNTPELFVIAPKLDEEVFIYAYVDEADIGLIKKAEKEERDVHFTVDAYPDTLFEGKIDQIRMNSTTEQYVVTYPVVIRAPNPGMKLLPGMTAGITFEIETKKDVVRIPNAALRFYPNKPELVCEEDRKILEGAVTGDDEEEDDDTEDNRPAGERVKDAKKQAKRHVWVTDKEGKLHAIPVTVGLSDHEYTELVEGDLKPGRKLVVGAMGP